MRGVNYPVIGISDKGDVKLMMPNRNYQFNGESVTEYPLLDVSNTGDTRLMMPTKHNWNNLSMRDKSNLMKIYIKHGITSLDEVRQHYNSFAAGGALPDHDPNNPYHYHSAQGEKIVITPEDWEANVGKPYFKETEQAVLAEQAAYPEPEYEVNPNFVRGLRGTYSDSMGYGYQNYRNFGSSLPQGYSFTDEGLIVDPQGNYYVQSGYRQSPRFTYNTDNPLKFIIRKGTPIEKNLTFYPINMEKKLKEPLPIDRVMNVNEELVKPIRQSSTQPKTAFKNTVKHKTTIPVRATPPQSKQYGNAKWNALSQKQKRAIWDFVGTAVTKQKYTGLRGAFNHEGYSVPVYSPSLSNEATEGYWSADENQKIDNFIHSYKTWGDVIKAIGLKDDVKNLPDYRIYEPRATLVRPSNNYESNPKYKQSLNLLDSIFNAHENTNPLFHNLKHTKALGGYLFAHGGETDGSKEDKNKRKPDNPPTRTYDIPMVQPMVSTMDPMGGLGYQAVYFTEEQEKKRAAAEAEAQRREAERIARQPVLRADTRTQADRDRAARQAKQAEYNRLVNEQKDRLMSVGRPNTESQQAAILGMPYVAEAAKNYVQNFDPTAEIRNAMYFVPGVSNVMMAQDAKQAFDNNQTGAGVLNAAFALTPVFGLTTSFKSPLRYTKPANRIGDWTILDYGHNTAATTVQESSTASMLNMPSSLRLGSAERPSLSARPTQGSIGTTNRLQLPEMTESFRALENEAFGMDYLRSLYLNDGRISHQNPKTPKTQIYLPEYIKPQIRPLIRGKKKKKQLSKTGTISRKSLDAYIAKQGKYYQEAMNETLESDFKDMDKINYTDFQNAVQKRLPEYSRIPQTRYQKYGFNNLGLNTLNRDSLTEAELLRYAYDDELAALEQIDEDFDKGNINSDDRLSLREEIMDEITSTRLNTFTFETPGITGQSEHYSGKPVGHSRTYTTETEPEILHVMESQSDYAQHLNIERAKRHTLLKHMIDTYTERQIQENLKYAAEQGQTKMRYPTRKTVAKIEGYQCFPGREYYEITIDLADVNATLYGLTHPPVPPIDITGRNTVGELREAAEVQQRNAKIMESDMYKQTIKKAAELEKKRKEACDERHLEYLPEHETILKKYDAFPKQFQKLFGKKAEVRTVTDSRGNTWYEVDVPESYKNGTGQIIFSLGGLLGLGAGVNNH